MSEENQAKSQTVHISFTHEELAQVDEAANAAGLRRPAYIRQAALGSSPEAYDPEPVRQHTMEVSHVLTQINAMLSRRYPDRWAYQADIERIEGLLKNLLATELALNESALRGAEQEDAQCQS